MKTFIKQTILQAVETLGINALYRYINRRKLLCLCYHSVISDDAPLDDRTNIAVTVSQFDAQMQELCKHWNPLAHQSTAALPLILPNNAVFVSFDDGWRNNLTLAAPILAKYGMPATVFLTTDYIGTTGQLFEVLEYQERANATPEQVGKFKRLPLNARRQTLDNLRKTTEFLTSGEGQLYDWKRELYEFLSWDEVRQLRQMGWTIGGHTKTHQILSALSGEHLERELSESKSKIETELGEPCETLAYPNGSKDDYNEETIAVAKRLNFQTAFTLENRRNTETFDPMRIHRICITRDLTLNSFRAIISGVRGM